MKVTRKSDISGRVHTMDLPITRYRLDAWLHNGLLIQEAFPELTADEREFLLSGITPEEWTEVFPPEEDEQDEIDRRIAEHEQFLVSEGADHLFEGHGE